MFYRLQSRRPFRGLTFDLRVVWSLPVFLLLLFGGFSPIGERRSRDRRRDETIGSTEDDALNASPSFQE